MKPVAEMKLASGSATRVAEPFELLRLRTQRFINRTGKKPHILLAEIGDAKMRSARSQFAADFLACAGLVTSKTFFENAKAIADCDADLIVLCSADAEYLSIAVELIPMLKQRASSVGVIVAGNPETAEQLRDIGIFDFIHLRSNAVDVLGRIQQRMGIED
jgi:methylmalonyl-CoA mutase